MPLPQKDFGEYLRYTPNKEVKQVLKLEELEYTIRTNSLGLRSKELQTKQENEYRVVIFGDSFMFGPGVNDSDTVASYLEAIPKQNPKGKFKLLSVYNYSISGLNTVQELVLYRHLGKDVNPDQVILGVFIGNDIIPNAITSIDERGNYVSFQDNNEMFINEVMEDYGILSFGSVLLRVFLLEIYVPRIRYQISLSSEIINETYRLIQEFKRHSQQLGIQFSVVLLYPKDSVRGGIVQAWSGSRRIGFRIAEYCKKNGIEVVDMLEYMNGKESQEEFYFPTDGHLNKNGNYVVAQAIFNTLIVKRLNGD